MDWESLRSVQSLSLCPTVEAPSSYLTVEASASLTALAAVGEAATAAYTRAAASC